jgi:hypothetical protein
VERLARSGALQCRLISARFGRFDRIRPCLRRTIRLAIRQMLSATLTGSSAARLFASAIQTSPGRRTMTAPARGCRPRRAQAGSDDEH